MKKEKGDKAIFCMLRKEQEGGSMSEGNEENGFGELATFRFLFFSPPFSLLLW